MLTDTVLTTLSEVTFHAWMLPNVTVILTHHVHIGKKQPNVQPASPFPLDHCYISLLPFFFYKSLWKKDSLQAQKNLYRSTPASTTHPTTPKTQHRLRRLPPNSHQRTNQTKPNKTMVTDAEQKTHTKKKQKKTEELK
jgi:hypothetical protein